MQTIKTEPGNGKENQTVSPPPGSGTDRIIVKKRWTLRNIAILSGGGLFLFLVLYYLVLGDHRSKLNVEAEKITISDVTRGRFQEFDRSAGPSWSGRLSPIAREPDDVPANSCRDAGWSVAGFGRADGGCSPPVAVEALGRIGADSPESVAALRGALSDDSDDVKFVAKQALEIVQGGHK